MRVRNKTLVEQVMKRDIGLCQCCGFKADEVHHIIPLSKGGSDELSNMAALCNFDHRNAPDTLEEFNEYKKMGGAKLRIIVGQSMMLSDGNSYHEIMNFIKVLRNIDVTNMIEEYGVK